MWRKTMRGMASLAAVAFMATATSPRLDAQQYKQVHRGFWIGFGLGAGSAGASCAGCDNSRQVGLSGYFRLGGTISQQFLLGVETNGWVKDESGLNQEIGAFSAVGYLYPSPESGFFLKTGIGLLAYKADDGFDNVTATGVGLQGGLGVDLRVGRNFSLTPFVNGLFSVGSDANLDGYPLGGTFNANVVQFGLGVTWS